MSDGFKGFTDKEDKELKLNIRTSEINKIIKQYKKLKKYKKSSIHEITKLGGDETKIDKLINEYGIDSEAIED
jgi:hypothetical protein|tara:strand:- start:402 stop:620 length:219 start_codon:yes stop_codon:yes gene_type:complete